MNPFWFVIILLFIIASIPVTIVFFHSPLGKAVARYVDSLTQQRLKSSDPEISQKILNELEQHREMLQEFNQRNGALEEKYEFLERLLQPPDETKTD